MHRNFKPLSAWERWLPVLVLAVYAIPVGGYVLIMSDLVAGSLL